MSFHPTNLPMFTTVPEANTKTLEVIRKVTDIRVLSFGTSEDKEAHLAGRWILQSIFRKLPGIQVVNQAPLPSKEAAIKAIASMVETAQTLGSRAKSQEDEYSMRFMEGFVGSLMFIMEDLVNGGEVAKQMNDAMAVVGLCDKVLGLVNTEPPENLKDAMSTVTGFALETATPEVRSALLWLANQSGILGKVGEVDNKPTPEEIAIAKQLLTETFTRHSGTTNIWSPENWMGTVWTKGSWEIFVEGWCKSLGDQPGAEETEKVGEDEPLDQGPLDPCGYCRIVTWDDVKGFQEKNPTLNLQDLYSVVRGLMIELRTAYPKIAIDEPFAAPLGLCRAGEELRWKIYDLRIRADGDCLLVRFADHFTSECSVHDTGGEFIKNRRGDFAAGMVDPIRHRYSGVMSGRDVVSGVEVLTVSTYVTGDNGWRNPIFSANIELRVSFKYEEVQDDLPVAADAPIST